MVRIFCDRKEKDLKNFWNHIVFHPTDAIEEDWGQIYLNRMAEDNAVRTVRIYAMFEEMVTLDENGEMVFDFAPGDRRIDCLVSKGFSLCIAYAFIPPWLAADQSPERTKMRYKGRLLVRSHPYDYSKWEEICRVYTQHLVDRYGEDTVAGWRIHCYNEPDWYHFFDEPAENNLARAAEYCKLYDSFAAGVTSVSLRIPIGGPALAESDEHFEFFAHFLEHVSRTGSKLDYIAFHSYGTSPDLMRSGEKMLNIQGAVYNTLTVARLAKMYGFGHLPLVCDEWGASTEGYMGSDRCPPHEFRETEQYSAYFVRMLTLFDELELPYEQMMLCLSGQHGLEVNFGGHRNFFTRDYFAKPIYNAFVLANKLGDEKLYFYGEDPLTDAAVEDLAVMPTRHKDGRVSVLLCYADAAFTRELADKSFTFSFAGLESPMCLTKYVIDAEHANAYTMFKRLGRPAEITDEQAAAIRGFAALKAEQAGVLTPENAELELTMSNNAVVLLELEPQKA